MLNQPISEVSFNLKSLKELDELSKFIPNNGETLIKIKIMNEDNIFNFQLEKKRNIDRKTINLLRNRHISSKIV